MCNKRKWVAMLLVLLMLTLALAACQPNPVEPDGSGTGPEETVPPTEETTEPDSTESTSGAETETEMSRFDYFSADMNDYVTIDPSMYTDITVALDAELLVDDEDVAQYIIELRFGMKGGAELTQKEVADALGISQSYISRLEKKIMVDLRKKIEEKI